MDTKGDNFQNLRFKFLLIRLSEFPWQDRKVILEH